MTVEKPIRWGIIGTGFAAVHFADGLRQIPGAILAAVASQSSARAQAFAQRTGSERAFGAYEQMFEQADVDIIYVASGNAEHREHCLRAIAAGKAVLCEKPFALDGAQSREVVEAARAAGVFCMEALRTRFLPVLERVRTLIDQGRIGPLLSVQAQIGHRFAFESSSRFFDPSQGGGALFDLGVYPLSIALTLLGRPDTILGRAVLTPTGVDRDFQALLGFAGGGNAMVGASLASALPGDVWIVGEDGMIRLEGPVYSLQSLSVHAGPGAASGRVDFLGQTPGWKQRLRSHPRYGPAYGWAAQARRRLRSLSSPGEFHWAVPDGFADEAAEAMRCLRAGLTESPRMPLDDTLMLMDCLDRIRSGWSAEQLEMLP